MSEPLPVEDQSTSCRPWVRVARRAHATWGLIATGYVVAALALVVRAHGLRPFGAVCWVSGIAAVWLAIRHGRRSTVPLGEPQSAPPDVAIESWPWTIGVVAMICAPFGALLLVGLFFWPSAATAGGGALVQAVWALRDTLQTHRFEKRKNVTLLQVVRGRGRFDSGRQTHVTLAKRER